MKTAVVTGATGFIGKALVDELVKKKFEVYAISREKKECNLFREDNSVKLICCDLDNIKDLAQTIKGKQIDLFYHLAWEGTSGAGRENYEMQLLNIKHTCQAVEVCNEIGCNVFIYAGSLMEYESISFMNIQYSKPDKSFFYRNSKLAAHYLAKPLAIEYGIDFRIATISNAYGAGESSPRLINTVIRKLLNKEVVKLTDCEQLYDFIYITDVAKAFVCVGEEGQQYGNYYLGNKTPRKLKDFMLEIRNSVDDNGVLEFGAIKSSGINIDYSCIDMESLYRDTNFTCDVPFETGVEITIEWIKREVKGANLNFE